MTGFKKKIRFKTIISVVLVIVTLAGLAYGISRITKNDTKNVRSNYITGTLDVSNGELIENDKSIVSKEMFSCYGLTVTPDFDAYSSYQIFWYNMDKIYCGHTEVIKGVFSSNLPECAKYCRIVITPNKDQLGDDGKINFLEVSKFAGKIKVEVAKDQSVLPVNYVKVAQEKPFKKTVTLENFASLREEIVSSNAMYYEDICYFPNYTDMVENIFYGPGEEGLHAAMLKIDCSDVSSFKIFFDEENDSADNIVRWLITDASGNVLGEKMNTHYVGEGESVVVDIKSLCGANYNSAKYLYVSMRERDIDLVINKYLPR